MPAIPRACGCKFSHFAASPWTGLSCAMALVREGRENGWRNHHNKRFQTGHERDGMKRTNGTADHSLVQMQAQRTAVFSTLKTQCWKREPRKLCQSLFEYILEDP